MHRHVQRPALGGYAASVPDVGPDLTQAARTLVSNSLSANTRRAFASDVRAFRRAGGPLPVEDPRSVANFLAAKIVEGKAPATVSRLADGLSAWHRVQGYPDPTKHEIVRRVLRGMRRTCDMTQNAAAPLAFDDLKRMLDVMNVPGPRAARNRAMLSLGYFGAFRRSELTGLDVSDLSFHGPGVLVRLRRSKGNQEGAREAKEILRRTGGPDWCPVRLLEKWLATSRIDRGPLFPGIKGKYCLSDRPLTACTFNRIVQAAGVAIGLDGPGCSAHSLRSGWITEMYNRGASDIEIARISGHKSLRSLSRYIRPQPFAGPCGDRF